MPILAASKARANLYRLMDQTAESHQPITIAGKRNDAVLLAAEDWQAIQETLFLLSVPGMRESIKQGMVRVRSSSTRTKPAFVCVPGKNTGSRACMYFGQLPTLCSSLTSKPAALMPGADGSHCSASSA